MLCWISSPHLVKTWVNLDITFCNIGIFLLQITIPGLFQSFPVTILQAWQYWTSKIILSHFLVSKMLATCNLPTLHVLITDAGYCFHFHQKKFLTAAIVETSYKKDVRLKCVIGSYSIELDIAPENLFVGNVLDLCFCLAIKYVTFCRNNISLCRTWWNGTSSIWFNVVSDYVFCCSHANIVWANDLRFCCFRKAF